MILRITIKDNDFSERLNSLVTGLVLKVGDWCANNDKLNMWREFFKLINPNVTEKLCKDDKLYIEDLVTVVLKDIAGNDDIGEYISDNLRVSVVDKYEDKWENGEVLYYFTKSNTILEN